MERNRPLQAIWLGSIPYPEAVLLQEELARARLAEAAPDTLLFMEHPPVYTLGRNADAADFLVDQKLLETRGYVIHPSPRGGKITYHGPGQLVCWFVFNLYQAHRELRNFVETMEKTLCSFLGENFGIEAFSDPRYPGVWTARGKIAALGISVSRRITSHGFALNLNPALTDFDNIVPCGIKDQAVCSLASLGVPSIPPSSVLAPNLAERLARAYGRHPLVWQDRGASRRHGASDS